MNRFEKKLPPLVVVFITAIAMWLIALYTPTIPLAVNVKSGLVVLLLILAFVVILAGLFAFKRAKTTVDPRVPETASELVTSGVYQFTRNPMYLGFALILLAWAVYLASAFSGVMVIVFIVYLTQLQIKAEERALGKIFGQPYRDYQAKVRRWL